MIGYVTIGTNDLSRAAKFYEALLGELGGKRFMENERLIAWSAGQGRPGIGVCKPFDGKAATIGNGMMVALAVDSPEKVNALYDKALKLGEAQSSPTVAFILENLPRRLSERYVEELAGLTDVSRKEGESAQIEITKAIQAQAKAGTIRFIEKDSAFG